VHGAEAVAREREPLLFGFERRIPGQKRVAHELVGEHHAHIVILEPREDFGKGIDGRAPFHIARTALDLHYAGPGLVHAQHQAVRGEADAKMVTPQK
jgi:hypothetical protein